VKKALVVAVSVLILYLSAIAVYQAVTASREQVFWYPPAAAVQFPAAQRQDSPAPSAGPHAGVQPEVAQVRDPGIPAANTPGTGPATNARPVAPAPAPARPPDPAVEPRKFKIMIDAGHIRSEEKDASGDPEEYVLTYKTAVYLSKLFAGDSRFYTEISRGPERYDRRVLRSVKTHLEAISGILKEVNPIDRRSSWVSRTEREDLYGLRYYALDHGFDCLLSIHFDKVLKRSDRAFAKGFHLIVSPCNREYRRSVSFARQIIKSMKKGNNLNTIIDHNDLRIFPREARSGIDPERLRKSGVSVRSVVVLGDVYEYQYYAGNGGFPFKDIPSVLIESGFVHEKQFASEEGLKALARSLYEGIVSWREAEARAAR
jgi:N-acetylmuramoyl-L-alanine amidase